MSPTLQACESRPNTAGNTSANNAVVKRAKNK